METQLVKKLRDAAALRTKEADDPFEARKETIEWEAAAKIQWLGLMLQEAHNGWDECLGEIERLRAALRMVLENIGGHQHWDSFGTAGVNCPICQRQMEAAAQAWEVLRGHDRPCTCHPDDNPPRPCPKKYAYSECVKAASASPVNSHTQEKT